VRRTDIAQDMKKESEGRQALTDMPNIGREVSRLLDRAGISAPEERGPTAFTHNVGHAMRK
jgi:hypothetical protein